MQRFPRPPEIHSYAYFVTAEVVATTFGGPCAVTLAPATIWLLRLSATRSPAWRPEPNETTLPSSLAIETSLNATTPFSSTTATCGPVDRNNKAAAGTWKTAAPLNLNVACTYMPGTSARL